MHHLEQGGECVVVVEVTAPRRAAGGEAALRSLLLVALLAVRLPYSLTPQRSAGSQSIGHSEASKLMHCSSSDSYYCSRRKGTLSWSGCANVELSQDGVIAVHTIRYAHGTIAARELAALVYAINQNQGKGIFYSDNTSAIAVVNNRYSNRLTMYACVCALQTPPVVE